METFSAWLALCAGNSPHKGQWRGLWCFFDLRLEWSGGWWFDTPSRPLWCHCNGIPRFDRAIEMAHICYNTVNTMAVDYLPTQEARVSWELFQNSFCFLVKKMIKMLLLTNVPCFFQGRISYINNLHYHYDHVHVYCQTIALKSRSLLGTVISTLQQAGVLANIIFDHVWWRWRQTLGSSFGSSVAVVDVQ